MPKVYLVLLTTVFFLFFFSPVFAQPGPPMGPPCGGPFGPACPIDGGISLLVAAGLAYGSKKTYDISRKQE